MDNIKDIIPNVVDKMAASRKIDRRQLQQIWAELVGVKAAAHCALEDLKDGNLIACVDSSAWLFQLNAKKSKILAGLRHHYPELKNLRLKIGTIK